MALSFNVSDMTCNHCVKSITKAIHAVAPDSSVLCELDNKKVTVEGATDPKRVEEAIREAGYSPKQIQ